jgi:hypothetical protein
MEILNNFYSIYQDEKTRNEFDIKKLDDNLYRDSVASLWNIESIKNPIINTSPPTIDDYDNKFVDLIVSLDPIYIIEDCLNYHFDNYKKDNNNVELFIKHIEFVIIPKIKIFKRQECLDLINIWINKNKEIMIRKQLQEKTEFLKKAYEKAIEVAPSSPLSVSLKPIEFGKSIGFSESKTKRIMHELVNDDYVQSSLGMGILIVTNNGLKYLQELEIRPELPPINFNVGNNSNIQFQQGTINSNQTNMIQSEKLDLILRELYKYKNDRKSYSIRDICKSHNIPIDSDVELNTIAHRLENDGLIKAYYKYKDCIAQLTSHGIEYCEENSYTELGHSIITNNYSISIVNSPNSNIVNQSQNVSISQSISEVNDAIEKIRETINSDISINKEKVEDILECLIEIQENIKNNKKPKFAIKSLIDITGGISSIASWITVLGQFAGIIPPIA